MIVLVIATYIIASTGVLSQSGALRIHDDKFRGTLQSATETMTAGHCSSYVSRVGRTFN